VSYFSLSALLRTEAGATSRAAWVPGDVDAAHLDEDKRLLRREVAGALARSAQGARGVLAERSDEPRTEPAPLPYALADLQVDAGKRLGLGAAQVLDAAQSLYETHQLTTYPRSDCRYLPEEHHVQAPAVLAAAARQIPSLAPIASRADRTLRSKAWADAKVTAHHGIVPTPATAPLRVLSANEAAVYELVARRYIAQFFPSHAYVQSELGILLESGARFRATGSQVTAPGWKGVFTQAAPETDDTATDASEEESNLVLPWRRHRPGLRRVHAAPPPSPARAAGDGPGVRALRGGRKRRRPPAPIPVAS
jgi:DNA topoisomerase-3